MGIEKPKLPKTTEFQARYVPDTYLAQTWLLSGLCSRFSKLAETKGWHKETGLLPDHTVMHEYLTSLGAGEESYIQLFERGGKWTGAGVRFVLGEGSGKEIINDRLFVDDNYTWYYEEVVGKTRPDDSVRYTGTRMKFTDKDQREVVCKIRDIEILASEAARLGD